MQFYNGENGGAPGMVALLINRIYTIYGGYLLSISAFKGLLEGFKQLGDHFTGTTIFPMMIDRVP